LKIKRLYIEDFGILRNQILEDLHPGIVVIGGLNRAGKTTLMQVLRYLGYGFPQSGQLPPATNKHKAEADIILDSGDIYNISLSGYGQPVLKRIPLTEEKTLNDEIINVEDIFGIDDFTYRQLFTITLDELNRNYGISDHEKRKLQSILLGAGFKDILLLPQLKDEFYKEGDRIGGKRGSPRVKQFKSHYLSIEKGADIKRKALSQVEEYKEKQQELEEKKSLYQQIGKELEQLQNEIVRLDIIKNNYKAYKDIQTIETWLHSNQDKHWDKVPSEYELSRLESLRDEYVFLYKDFQDKEIELGLALDNRKSLLDNKEEMASLIEGISGINERVRQCTEQEEEYNRKRQQLVAKIRETNAAWDEKDMEDLVEIKTDNISHSRLSGLVDEYRDLVSDHKNHKANLVRMQEEYNTFQDQAVELEDKKPWGEVKKYFYTSLAFILLGIILVFINPFIGTLLGLGGIGITAVYYIMTYLNSREARGAVQAQKQQLEARKSRVEAEEKLIKSIEKQIESIKTELDEYKQRLDLSIDVPDSTLPGHLLRIRDIQEGIGELDEIYNKIQEDRGYLEEQYNRYRAFISQFTQEGMHVEQAENYSPENWSRLAAELNRWNNYLKETQGIYVLQQKIEAVEQEIIEILEKYETTLAYQDLQNRQDLENSIAQFIDRSQEAMEYNRQENRLREIRQSVLSSMSSDGVRRAFGYSISNDEGRDEKLLNIFMEICSSYASQEEVEEVYSAKCREREDKIEELDRLKEEGQKLEDVLERLATTENLVRGQRQIDNARAELKILAHSYAVNMTAAFLLKEAEERLLQSMKDSIMDSAGNIFSQMTNGDYKGIQPAEPLLDGDFEAILSGEKSRCQTVDMLSRGTREQLYLSVRISRIMDIKPNLPVIIDDSFANFDSRHLGQSIGILSQLAKTHQIFILTCHGELVDEIARAQCQAQYWKIDRGRIEISDYDKLSSHLRVS
jgi:uncharacterized protein YhaN